MKFLCGSCRTKYQISDDKVRGKILTIRCKKCGAKVMVKESLARQGGIAIAPLADEGADEVQVVEQVAERSAAAATTSRAASASLSSAFDVAMGAAPDDMPTSIAPTPQNQDEAGVEWYAAVDGSQQGPFAFAELVRKIRGKELAGRHYVWHDGMEGWKRIRDVADLGQYVPQDKKPPPPPPPEGGEEGKVVDFAQKRAERNRKSSAERPASEERGPESREAGAEGATTPVAQTHGQTDRVEQLDSVLNEALGIQGEGRTAQATPSAAQALSGGAGIASPPPGLKPPSDFSDFSAGGSAEALPENLFDHVPRANPQEMVGREATRFFVAAAGVDAKKSRNKVGMLIGAGIATSVVAFFSLWALGIIQVNIPGLGNPFQQIGRGGQVEMATGELTPEQMAELKRALAERDGTTGPVQPKQPRKRRPASPGAGGGAALPGDYVDDSNDSGGEARSREGEAERIDLGTGGGAEGPGSAPLAALPQADVSNIPLPETGKLDDNMVRQVLNDGKRAVSSCYTRELRANEGLRGKLEVLVTIQPNGTVSRATVETGSFKGTALGECVAKKMKELHFPPFGGAARQYVVPFVLEKTSY